MKKKLLFVHPRMGFGGAEKSLQTLLTQLDASQYDIDLFLFQPQGELLELLPEYVHLLPQKEKTQIFMRSLHGAVPALLRSGRIRLAVARACLGRVMRGEGTERERAQRGWKFLRTAFPPLRQEYDAAIAYLEGLPVYFCADRVRAKNKIAYIHNDYRKLEMNAAFDEPYLRQFDSIVTVSDSCADVLREVFPQLADRVRVVENIISPELLGKTAQQGEGFDDGYDGLRLLTLGRLDAQKGYDMALDACAALMQQYDFRWYALGNGPLQKQLEDKIRALHLEDRFILLGTRLNPYPYLQQCDIYVQPSRFEGKSIALEEAKALRRPIVTTAFTTVANQITDGVTGSIAAISAEAIAEKVGELLRDASLRERYTQNLQSYTGNVSELEKFYALLT